jgi:hypothetical protein
MVIVVQGAGPISKERVKASVSARREWFLARTPPYGSKHLGVNIHRAKPRCLTVNMQKQLMGTQWSEAVFVWQTL